MQEQEELKTYRRAQRRLAIIRDQSLCTVCWFIYNKKKQAVHVHHVYGRAQRVDETKESFTKLLCVCYEHHVQPILVHKEELQWIEAVLYRANTTPINPNFKFRGNDGLGVETQ